MIARSQDLRLVCFLQRKTLPVSTDFDGDNNISNPQKLEATHPQAFEIVPYNKKNNKRQQCPGPTRVAISDKSNGMKGCDDKYIEKNKADIPHLQRRIIIAIVGVRHHLDPAWGREAR